MDFPTLCDRVYAYIWDYVTSPATEGTLPTQSDVAEALGVSPKRVGRAIRALREDGRLVRKFTYPVEFGAWWTANVRQAHPVIPGEPFPAEREAS